MCPKVCRVTAVIQTNTFAYDIVNSVAYLVIFLPAFLLLLILEYRNISRYRVQFLATKKGERSGAATIDADKSPSYVLSRESVAKEE